MAGRKRVPEGGQVLAAEDRGEGTDGEEKPGRRRDPARAVAREGAAGDEAVDVQVLGEVLPPGVQDRRDAEVAAEIAAITPEGGERLGDSLEEEAIEHPGVALGEGVQSVRQREDDVEVRDR